MKKEREMAKDDDPFDGAKASWGLALAILGWAAVIAALAVFVRVADWAF